MLINTKGDMFNHSVQFDVFVNTVNCVGVMGKGVALEFKNRYPDMFLKYRLACLQRLVKPGKMFYWLNPSADSSINSIIINFPTKRHWANSSLIEDITDGLISLRDDLVYVFEHIKLNIALPPLGCGNGGLEWTEVYKLIYHYLSTSHHNIYVFEPEGYLNGSKVV